MDDKRLAEIEVRVIAAGADPYGGRGDCQDYRCYCHDEILALVAEVRRLREALTETRLHLKYASNIAMRLGPKAHNTHREEALGLLDGTMRAAEAVYKKWAT